MSSPSIRNVVLVGHNGNGKTTLAEAMLYRAGVVGRMGRVDDGTAHCDHDPEEKARHQSLSLSDGVVRLAGPPDQPHRHPGLHRFRGRGRQRHARRRPGCVRGGRRVGGPGPGPGAVASRRTAGSAPDGVRERARPGALVVRAHPGRPAVALRLPCRGGGAPAGHGGVLLRHRRSGGRQCPRLQQRAVGGRADSRRRGAGRFRRPHPALGGCRGGRRRTSGAVSGGGRAHPGATGAAHKRRGRPAQRVPGAVRLGGQAHRRGPPPRLHLPGRTRAGRRRPGRRGAGHRDGGTGDRRCRSAGGAGVQHPHR